MGRAALIEIDLAKASSSAELQALLRDSLDFPGWYGCNWNAFWDAITGLVDMPETLRFVGWTEFSSRLPGDAELMIGCLQEMTDKYPELASKVAYA
ncbi:barstar family protein [Roseateles sp. P5_E11]